MKRQQTPPPTIEKRRRSLVRERRAAMLLAVGLIRHAGRQLIRDGGGDPEPFRLPEFDTAGEAVGVGASLLALANRLEPDRQHTTKTPRMTL